MSQIQNGLNNPKNKDSYLNHNSSVKPIDLRLAIPKYRVSLCRLQTTSHKLKGAGIHHQKHSHKLCYRCNDQLVEDKIHFVIVCKKYRLVEKVQTESPLGKSHHKIINFNIRSYIQKKAKLKTKCTYDRGDYSMRQEMAKIEWDQTMEGKNLEET